MIKNVILFNLICLLIFNACEPYKQTSNWVDENSEIDTLSITEDGIIGNATASISDSTNLADFDIYTVLQNASFESSTRAHSTTPTYWKNCGNPSESPTDIQPGFFQVKTKAQDGDNYLGMILRDNGSSEALGQFLKEPLERGKQYAFSFYVARSPNYISLSKSTMAEVNFNEPALLRVKLGSTCADADIIGQTNVIESEDWQKYTIAFTVEGYGEFLMFEAYYEDGFPINGNVLLDNISPIYEIATD